MAFRPFVIALSLPALLAACEQPKAAPTYHANIAPLYAEQCVSCHQEGGIAPFSLVTERYRASGYVQSVTLTEGSQKP